MTHNHIDQSIADKAEAERLVDELIAELCSDYHIKASDSPVVAIRKRLLDHIAKVRDDALEEAAMVADKEREDFRRNHCAEAAMGCLTVERAIRALKSKGGA